jgi:hypothetical protein
MQGTGHALKLARGMGGINGSVRLAPFGRRVTPVTVRLAGSADRCGM